MTAEIRQKPNWYEVMETRLLVRWQNPVIMEKLAMSVYNIFLHLSIVLCEKMKFWLGAFLQR